MFDLDIDSIEYIKNPHKRKQDMHRFFIMPRKFSQRETMEKLTSICYECEKKQLVFSNTHNDAEYLASNVQDALPKFKIRVHRGGFAQQKRKIYEIHRETHK